jgi:hypothetical protein
MGFFDDALLIGRNVVGAAAEAFAKALPVNPPTGDPEQDFSLKPPASMGGDVPTEKAEDDPKSLFYDPFSIIEQLGYKDRPSQISYGTLKNIVWKMPIIHAVIHTRVNQVAAFAQPQANRYQMGYRIRLKDHEAKPSPADKKWARKCEAYLSQTGVTDNPIGRDNFEAFLRKLTWDSLVYDQACGEIVPNRKGQPAEWYAVDAASIRQADTATTYMNEDLDEAIRYVQIYDGMIVSEYTQNEMIFGVRNPRSDMRQHGYGTSELEMLIPAVTSLLWAWQYNSKFFSSGSAAKGILNFKGAVPEKQLRAFRRHWYQMLSGVENAWRTPITNADELQWVNMQNTNRDMEFSAWIDFLIKVVCSIYCLDPVEINFQYGNVGQSSTLQEASNKDKITESKERGLRPILNYLSTWINRGIIWPLNPNFEFEFVGLDARTRDEVNTYNQTAVRTIRTIDELRAEDDLPALPNGTGQVLLDPGWLQVKQAAEQAKQQAQQPMGGMPGMPPGMGQPPQQQLPPGPPQQQQQLPGQPGMDFGQMGGEQSEPQEWAASMTAPVKLKRRPLVDIIL